MTVTFIAVDFPMAMFGYKKRATATQSPFVANQNDIDQLTAWKGLDGFQLKQNASAKDVARKNALTTSQQNEFKDVQGAVEFEFVSRLAQGKPTWRVACCGSLDAVFKYAQYLHVQNNMQVSRLVFLGHGNTGVMAIGSGKADMDSVKNPAKFKPGSDAKPARVRELTHANRKEWKPMFQAAAGCFTGADDELVYIYLLGCKTAAAYEGNDVPDRTFSESVARGIAKTIGRPTVVVGAMKKLQEDHLRSFFNSIDDSEYEISQVLTGDSGSTSHDFAVGDMQYRAVLGSNA